MTTGNRCTACRVGHHDWCVGPGPLGCTCRHLAVAKAAAPAPVPPGVVERPSSGRPGCEYRGPQPVQDRQTVAPFRGRRSPHHRPY